MGKLLLGAEEKRTLTRCMMAYSPPSSPPSTLASANPTACSLCTNSRTLRFPKVYSEGQRLRTGTRGEDDREPADTAVEAACATAVPRWSLFRFAGISLGGGSFSWSNSYLKSTGFYTCAVQHFILSIAVDHLNPKERTPDGDRDYVLQWGMKIKKKSR